MVDNTETLKNQLLNGPDTHIDAGTKESIRKWDSPASATNILQTLDCATFSGGASSIVLYVLDELLRRAIANENTTYDDVVKSATWREK